MNIENIILLLFFSFDIFLNFHRGFYELHPHTSFFTLPRKFEFMLDAVSLLPLFINAIFMGVDNIALKLLNVLLALKIYELKKSFLLIEQ
jgi:hypothetical protein